MVPNTHLMPKYCISVQQALKILDIIHYILMSESVHNLSLQVTQAGELQDCSKKFPQFLLSKLNSIGLA